jgi:large subunit ribosomal protein L9
MEIVLLERVEHLGHLGDVVKVKPGFARNYLFPQKKALRATKSNLEFFEKQKAELQARNAKQRSSAETDSKKIDGVELVIVRQASEAGQLYGSVAARDVAEALVEAGHKVERRHVVLEEPLKTLGIFPVRVSLHPEVSVTITVNIARSAEEAKTAAEKAKAPVAKEETVSEDLAEAEQPEVV